MTDKSEKRIQKFVGYGFNGGWTVTFEFDKIVNRRKTSRRKDAKTYSEEWVVIDILRRRRKPESAGKTNRYWFRSLSGRVTIHELAIRIPEGTLIIELNEKSLRVPAVFDFPLESEKDINQMKDWPFIATAFQFEISTDSKGKWPDFVSSAVLRSKTGKETSLTLKTFLESHFELAEIKPGDGIILNPDGLTIKGRKKVPWEPSVTLPGKFRYRFDSSGNHLLEIEKNVTWISSLRAYQHRVIKATSLREDDAHLPEVTSPGIGLVSTHVPDKVFWFLEAKRWTFRPDKRMFEGEVRGAAGGTSRLQFDQVLILKDGNEVQCISGVASASEAQLKYDYDDGKKNVWTGEFEASLEPVSRELMRSLMLQYGFNDSDLVWIQTESGPLQVPLAAKTGETPKTTLSADGSIFRGLIRFSEVPWTRLSDDLPASPDISKVRDSSLTVVSADYFSASITFDQAGGFRCKQVKAVITEPVLRMEDFLPIYLPPANGKPVFNNGPPDLPTESTPDGWNSFFGLNLIRGRNYLPDKAETSFKLKVSWRPGIADKSEPFEGDWTDSYTKIVVPPARKGDIQYWYRPPGLHWLPGLPLYGKPGNEDRLNAKRTYLPLVAADETGIVLRPGINWQVPVLMEGNFQTLPEEIRKAPYSIYYWVAPELPGIMFEPASAIKISEGLLNSGKVTWIWRHDLPVLDELNALRSSQDEKKDQSTEELLNVNQADWVIQLRDLFALSQADRTHMFTAQLDLKQGLILAENGKSVTVENLVGKFTVAGKADLQVAPPSAALQLTAASGSVEAISRDTMLKGVTTGFALDYDRTNGKLDFAIKTANAPLKIEAGTMPPVSSKTGKDSITFDQLGGGVFHTNDVTNGRMILVPGPDGATLQQVWLWSSNPIDFSTGISQTSLTFAGIPLTIQDGHWSYRKASPLISSELRDFSWGSIGQVSFWGLPFQVCSLIALEFEQTKDASPAVPSRLVFDGVLHLKPGVVSAADPHSQRVQVTFERDGATWKLGAFDGEVLWPFFETAPDLSSTLDSSDPLPWLSSTVKLVKAGAETRLTFGVEAAISFEFIERIWKLPVTYAEGAIGGVLSADHTFKFTLTPAANPVYSRLYPTSGAFYLSRSGTEVNSQMVFNILVAHEGSAERSLLDITFDYTIGKLTEILSLRKANILSFGNANHLVSITAEEKGIIDQSPGKLALTINKPAGWAKDKPLFELLPGWSISDNEPLQAYLNLAVEPPPLQGEVREALLKDLQLVLETGVATPNLLSTLITYSLRTAEPPQLSIKLTGVLAVSNDISWPAEADASYVHDVEFILRQSTLRGNQLESTGAAFFRPRYTLPSANETTNTGMIELPCLANHRIKLQKGNSTSTVLQWTAAQCLRISHTKSFIGEVLLRGETDPQLPAVEYEEASKQDYSYEDLTIGFRPALETELGFVGALGTELEKLLKKTQDLMVFESTEAFWLRPIQGEISGRSAVDLWKHQDLVLTAIPTFDLDFDDSGRDAVSPWTRLPVPFLADSTGYIRTKKTAALQKLLANLPTPASTEEYIYEKSTFLLRDSILKLNEIDQLSLDNQPAAYSPGNGFDQVIFDPVSFEKLFPFTTAQPGFQPGWLTFYEWQLSNPEDSPRGIVFGATLGAVRMLKSAAGSEPVTLTAVTESVPKVKSLPGNAEFKFRCYYIASPFLTIGEKKLTGRAETHSVRTAPGVPRILADWKGIASMDELNFIPQIVNQQVLIWVNTLDADALKEKIEGGLDDRYGIGDIVLDRIKERVQQVGVFTSIDQLLQIQGLDLDKLGDLIYSAAQEKYDLEAGRFEEIRINVQFWLAPGESGGIDNELVLSSESVFLIGLTEEDTWETILFGPKDRENYSKIRRRVWDWVDEEQARLNYNTAPLLRARLLTPSSLVEDRFYYLVTSRYFGGTLQKSRRRELNTLQPLFIDPRFESMPTATVFAPHAAGPELIGGKVYYEPRTWSDPALQVVDNQEWKGIISEFSIEPSLVSKGEVVHIRWTCEVEGLLQLTDSEGTLVVVSGNGIDLKPPRTGAYTLILRNQTGEVLDQVAAALRVRMPAAGNALGLEYKVAGAAPGPASTARRAPSSTNPGYHTWMETIRDLSFSDITRPPHDDSIKLEPGELLPASRKISFENKTTQQVASLESFPVPRIEHLFASGRPGAMMKFRMASLTAGADARARRGDSWSHAFRFPRPVPLPRELYPFHPDRRLAADGAPLTCSVKQVTGPEPFTIYGLAWQDPIFNRRLHAVMQENVQGSLYVSLDRTVYGGNDIFYPEVKVLDKNLTGWQVKLDVRLQRIQNGKMNVIEGKSYGVTRSQVTSLETGKVLPLNVVRDGETPRFIFELGIDRAGIDGGFITTPENEDLLTTTTSLIHNGIEMNRIQLTALIRTDRDSWSQPQNAYGVIRKTIIGAQAQSELVGFGWAPKPAVVKRRDRFRTDSWEGTFGYRDVFVKQPKALVDYEVISITSYGEMKT